MIMANELLAPAGNLEAVKVAINNGADAVYCAGKKFGARAFVNNLTNEEIIEASHYVHLYQKKIYITLNTLIFEDEFDEVKEYVDFLYHYVDGLIVQDFGVVHYVRSHYPDFPVHISTQCSIHNKEDLLFLKNIGVKRVVLARETPIETIKELNSQGIELEVFIHGALCFSYSGMCYLSYYKGGRSGNRGSCAQPCRQEYSLYEDDELVTSGPLLSMKDLNTIHRIKDILSLGVSSLKIEGRAKSLEYIASVTRIYRKLIDDFNNGLEPKVTSEMLDDLYASYSRETTNGYILNEKNGDITTTGSVRHQGIKIGTVVASSKNQIKVKLNKELELQDGIRIIDGNFEDGLTVTRIIENGNLVKKSSGVVYIDVKHVIHVGAIVYKTQSNKVTESLKTVKLCKNNQFLLEISIKQGLQTLRIHNDKFDVIKDANEILEVAKNVKEDNVINQFKKTNNLPIEYVNIKYENPQNLYIPIPQINELRSALLLEVKDLLENTLEREAVPYSLKENCLSDYKPIDYLVLKEGENYTNNLITDENDDKNLVAFHLFEIDENKIISPYFGVTNSSAISFFRNFTKNVIILSYESTFDNSISLARLDAGLGYLVEYNEPLMIAKHCVVAKAFGYKEKGCGKCLKHQYKLKDKDRYYNLKFNHCIMQIEGKHISRKAGDNLIPVDFS